MEFSDFINGFVLKSGMYGMNNSGGTNSVTVFRPSLIGHRRFSTRSSGPDSVADDPATAAPDLRIRVTGCAPFDVGLSDLWQVVLNRRVIFYLGILGAALASMTASNIPSAFSQPYRVLIALSAISLILFLTPFSVTMLTALFCRWQYRIARRLRLPVLGFDGDVVRTRWIVMLTLSLYLNISAILLIFEVTLGFRVSATMYLGTPLFWVIASEGFSAFAAMHILPATGLITYVSEGNAAGAPDEAVEGGRPASAAAAASSAGMPWQLHLGKVSVDLKDAIILRSGGNYVEITDPTGGRLVRTTLSSALKKIRADAGLQVHRSYWASFPACERLEQDGPDLYLHTTLGERLKVAKPRQAHVLGQLESRNIPVVG